LKGQTTAFTIDAEDTVFRASAAPSENSFSFVLDLILDGLEAIAAA